MENARQTLQAEVYKPLPLPKAARSADEGFSNFISCEGARPRISKIDNGPSAVL